jgi:hypothetical protein
MTTRALQSYSNRLNERYYYLEKQIKRFTPYRNKEKNISERIEYNYYIDELINEKDIIKKLLDFYKKNGAFN